MPPLPWLLLALALLAAPLSLPARAFAEGATTSSTAPPNPAAPEKKPLPPGFEPVKGGEARAAQVDANALVVAAYAAFFLLLFGFVLHVVRTQARMAAELKELSSKLDRLGKG
jgi:CcmD family protein